MIDDYNNDMLIITDDGGDNNGGGGGGGAAAAAAADDDDNDGDDNDNKTANDSNNNDGTLNELTILYGRTKVVFLWNIIMSPRYTGVTLCFCTGSYAATADAADATAGRRFLLTR